MNIDYKKILMPYRVRKSTIQNRIPLEEYYSDCSRITYSSSFRRLQQKAQVFPLEPNSSVRTRLTHSLEVADLGRTLALGIAQRLFKEGFIEEDIVSQIVAIVVNSCLLHDIGNPPFGHFGEEAIKRWFETNWKECANNVKVDIKDIGDRYKDFIFFDGNPQGIRIVTRLHCECDQYGLNLSVPTLLSAIKYPFSSDEIDGTTKKKPGYFQTENSIIKALYQDLGLKEGIRYPLVYIVEAADDIAYSLSDISDGIEKRIITAEEFIKDFKDAWEQEYSGEPLPNVNLPYEKINYFNMEICVNWSRAIMKEAIDNYIKHHNEIFSGKASTLIMKNNGLGKILKITNDVARKKLYRSPEAENVELAGYSIITGLLNHFSHLLRLDREKFELFIDKEKDPKGNKLDLEWRLFNRISKRCIASYKYQVNEFQADSATEWFLRAHLILDHISNMTDDFALATYQTLEGIKVKV